MAPKYWASRIDDSKKDYVWSEVNAGRLRQGWGYSEDQDLRVVEETPWKERSVEQRYTDRQRHMLGKKDGWQVGDIVLIPKLPEAGMFALVEVTGPYRFEIDEDLNDYGHIREVRVLTPHGVANSSEIVHAGIRKTLGNRGRAWRPNVDPAEFQHIIEHAEDPQQIKRSTETQRAERALAQATGAAASALQDSFRNGLGKALGNAEWERVIALALRSHFPTATVEKTGGRSERGSDVTVEIPDPFGGATWVIVVQVKDYDGEIGAGVSGQLREAIRSYGRDAGDGDPGKPVISAILASTNAPPSAALIAENAHIEMETGVPVTVIHGDALMELILRGLVQNDMFRSA